MNRPAYCGRSKSKACARSARTASPSNRAVVVSAKASEPELASLNAYEQTVSAASRGRYFAFCASLPHSRRALIVSVFCTSTSTPTAGFHCGNLFNRQDRAEERSAHAAMLFRDLNSHQPQRKQLLDQRGRHLLRLIHLPHQRRNFVAGQTFSPCRAALLPLAASVVRDGTMGCS